VEFRNVTKIYGRGTSREYVAISDVTFTIPDVADHGEISSFLGPSGCGKSTVLRLVAGLEPQHPPTSGTVTVLGREIVGPGADRGMVFQDYTSFDNRTVLDNVVFGLECRGVPRREREGSSGSPRSGSIRSATPPSFPTSSRAACGSGWRSPARSSSAPG
jgi:NitT/TauT family transport system ATP-binding protein